MVEEVGEEEIRLWGGEDGRNVGKKIETNEMEEMWEDKLVDRPLRGLHAKIDFHVRTLKRSTTKICLFLYANH